MHTIYTNLYFKNQKRIRYFFFKSKKLREIKKTIKTKQKPKYIQNFTKSIQEKQTEIMADVATLKGTVEKAFEEAELYFQDDKEQKYS